MRARGMGIAVAVALTALLLAGAAAAQVIDGESVFASLERLDRAILQQTELEEEARERLDGIKAELGALEDERGALNAGLASRRDLIRKRVRALYKYSGRGFLSAVLSDGGDLTTLARTRYLLFIVRRDMALLEAQKADLTRQREVREGLIARQGEVEAAARQAEVERQQLEAERQRRMALLDRIRKEEALTKRAQRERQVAEDRLAANVVTLGAPRPAPPAAQPPMANATASPPRMQAPPTSPSTPAPVASARPPVTDAPPPATQAPPAEAPIPLKTPARIASLPKATPRPTRRPPKATPAPTAKPARVASTVAKPPPTSAFEQRRGRHTFPTTGKVTRAYGRYRVEGMMAPAFSKGIEIVAPTGTPFKAVAAGTVQMADWFKGYGLMVIVNHGGDYRSIYTHASRLLVKVGDKVQAGDVIGLVGETGSLKGPYLYLEIRRGTSPINPLEWLKVPPGVMALESP